MAKRVKTDCVRRIEWLPQTRPHDSSQYATRHYRLVTITVNVITVNASYVWIRCVTFTFAGFLLFSVMPRDCVAEIESAAPLDTPNVRWKCIVPPHLHPARTKVRGNDDDFALPRWKREHEAARISRAWVSRIQFNIQYPTRHLCTARCSYYNIVIWLPLRGHCRYKPVNRNVKYRARLVPRFLRRKWMWAKYVLEHLRSTASLFCTLFKTDYDGNVTPLSHAYRRYIKLILWKSY